MSAAAIQLLSASGTATSNGRTQEGAGLVGLSSTDPTATLVLLGAKSGVELETDIAAP